MQKPNIFSYHDYRLFLRDWFLFLKQSDINFSIRALSREAKIATGYLSMVLNGKRKLSIKAIDKLRPFIHLSDAELSYLSNIAKIADSTDQEEREKSVKNCQKFKAYKDSGSKEIDAFNYLTNWYFVAIREMAALKDFKAEPEWIVEKLDKKITVSEAKNALEFLISESYLIYSEGNKLIPSTKQVDCTEGVYKVALAKFHKEMFRLAADSISNVSREKRNLLGHTVALSEKEFEQVKEIMNDTLRRIENIVTDDSLKKLYHIGLTSFPLTS